MVEPAMPSIAKRTTRFGMAVLFTALLWIPTGRAQQRQAVLEFVPARTSVEFALDAAFHVVHGTFGVDHGAIQFDPTSRAISGEIVVNAASGNSGNDSRDRRMQREILETARYPEIAFRPDRVEGTLEASGASTVQVHGAFRIHGVERELTIPVRIEMTDEHWTLTSHFVVPYVKWGIKNPSNLLLHVSPSVELDVQASGPKPWAFRGPK
jgi:polyisoprenoid-binding protein YceI